MFIMTEDDVRELAALGKPKSFKANEILYVQGSEDCGLFCILNGFVRTFSSVPSGAEKSCFIFGAPIVIGETPVLDRGPYFVSAQAVTDLKASIVERDLANIFIETHPEFALALLRKFTALCRGLQAHTTYVLLNSKQKIAHFLSNYPLYNLNCNVQQEIVITHEILANFLGVSRSKVTKYLNFFESLGFIEKKYNKIVVLDQQGLRDFYDK